MITATGNNFGAYTIQLKDYQSDKMVVLNGRFELNCLPGHFLFRLLYRTDSSCLLRLCRSSPTAVDGIHLPLHMYPHQRIRRSCYPEWIHPCPAPHCRRGRYSLHHRHCWPDGHCRGHSLLLQVRHDEGRSLEFRAICLLLLCH